MGLIGLFSLGNLLIGLPFVPFDVFDWLARILPGPVITTAIDLMVRVIDGLRLGPTASTAKLAEQGIAIFQFILLGLVCGLVVAAVAARWPQRTLTASLILASLAALVALLAEVQLGYSFAQEPATAVWIVLLLLTWGWLIAVWALLDAVPRAVGGAVAGGISRREFLLWVGGGSLALALAAFWLSRPRNPRALPVTAGPAGGNLSPTAVAETSGPAASPPYNTLAKRFQPAPGTRAEVTPNGQFYRIDINADIPTADAQTWRFKVDGLVDHPLELSIEDLRRFPSRAQMITLECISNQVGGDLISTALWKGVPLKTVLAEAGLKPEAKYINITSFDGFYEHLGLDEAMDERTLLVYDMNGSPLAAEHGFPLRIYIPNHYGMKQPKWIEHLEISDKTTLGYWVIRGWSATAVVQTTSVIDSVAINQRDEQQQTVPVGGIAFAGARGISRVEVQMDDGPWMEAGLRNPPLSKLTWVQWRYDAPYQKGHHVFKVRATDGEGKLQDSADHLTLPDGATGIFSFEADF